MKSSQSSRPPISRKYRTILQSLLRAAPSSIVVGIATFACFAVHANFAIVSFIFLIVVVLQSLAGDFASSAVVSVVAFLCLNYFFVPPIFSFAVSDPSDTLALISFLITGLVVTRLMARAREAASVAELQRAQTTRLYEVAQHLLASDPDASLVEGVLRPFRLRFSLAAVCLFDASTAELLIDGDSLQNLAEQTRLSFISGRNSQDNETGVAVRLVRDDHKVIGAIGFEGLRDVELTAEPLAALVGLITGRRLSFLRARHAAAAADAEVFRGAVLDALAHEFKTPLATIITAADGLKEAGPLRPAQRDLLEVVQSEASRLAQLTSRLLRLARLDREEVKPQMELTDLSTVIKPLVDHYSVRWPDRHLYLDNRARVDVLADRELLWLGIGQLVDNACKYSGAGTEIKVSVDTMPQAVVVRVWNNGVAIPAAEQARIFERFYRGGEARIKTPGSGLGLYVARKIALAHGGTLDLEQSVESGVGTAFRFTIPAANTNNANVDEIERTSRR